MSADTGFRLRLALLMALTGLLCGLAPQLLVHFSLELFNNLSALLFAVYASFFLSLALVLMGAALTGRLAGARHPLPGLRALLILDAVGLSALWYRLLNPFPAGPLIQNQQYLAVLPVILAPLLGWLFFLFLLKKIL